MYLLFIANDAPTMLNLSCRCSVIRRQAFDYPRINFFVQIKGHSPQMHNLQASYYTLPVANDPQSACRNTEDWRVECTCLTSGTASEG